MMTIEGNIVDVFNKQIFSGVVYVEDGRIVKIEAREDVDASLFIMPGFVDAHVHIESSMLIPPRFAEIAVRHGTVATVSDPHEIANVLGVQGVDYMIAEGKKAPLKFYFGAPSCVPATPYETSGAVVDAKQIQELLAREDVYYLAEMMNFPGVIHGDDEVYNKISSAHKNGKPVDGHAPGVRGENLQAYARAGITADHETTSRDEAVEKLNAGVKLQIRQGSAAKSFAELIELVDYYPEDVMFCTDDCHPDDLQQGHINTLVKRAWEYGSDFYDVLRVASVNPVFHYNLDVGLLREGDSADFVLVDNLEQLSVKQTYINGELVYDNGKVLFETAQAEAINSFSRKKIKQEDLIVKPEKGMMRVINAFDGSLETGTEWVHPLIEGGQVISDTMKDVLKIVVVNRYTNAKPSVAFIKGFGFNKGAIGGSIAHDSHNIIAVGVNDKAILKAVNGIIENRGGIVAVNNDTMSMLPLEVAGLMSREKGSFVASRYQEINNMAKNLGTSMTSPFMTLSFMALLVIPELKLGDKGLFDVIQFQPVSLFKE